MTATQPDRHPIALIVDDDLKLLGIPAFVISYVFRIVNSVVAFFGWFSCLALGRMPQGMCDPSAWMLQYELRTDGYAMLLTGRYPSFSGGPRV